MISQQARALPDKIRSCQSALIGQDSHHEGIPSDFHAKGFFTMNLSSTNPFLYEIQELILSHLPPEVRVMMVGDQNSPAGKQIASRDPQAFLHHTEQPWVRDYFPEIVFDSFKKPHSVVLFRYNHYNLKDPVQKYIASKVAQKLKLPLVESALIAEGGNLLSDGEGTLFVSKILIKNNIRYANHPLTSIAEIESELKNVLKMRRIIWLPDLPGDPTGHVDTYMMPFGHRKIALAKYPSSTPAGQMMDRIADTLRFANYHVERITTPKRINPNPSSRKCADILESFSYTNVILMGKIVFVPQYFGFSKVTFDLRAYDKMALEFWTQQGFQAIPIPASKMIGTGGSLHCISKAYPSLP
jgi:agmatine deiminase